MDLQLEGEVLFEGLVLALEHGAQENVAAGLTQLGNLHLHLLHVELGSPQ